MIDCGMGKVIYRESKLMPEARGQKPEASRLLRDPRGGGYKQISSLSLSAALFFDKSEFLRQSSPKLGGHKKTDQKKF
jgi:hypothetical protein